MTDGLLARLPAALRSRRDVLSDRERWAPARVVAADDHAAVLVRDVGEGPAVWAFGDTGSLGVLLAPALVAHASGARWVTAPRDVPVPPEVLAAAGVVPRTAWDRLTTATAPSRVAGEDAVRALDPVRDGAAIGACLDAANPTTQARPGADDDAAWWGVGTDDDLLGVIGVAWRGGVDRARSVHLHGLGVVPAARGRGLGTALTAVATRTALAAGAPWVSLGMYADNVAARRVYASLGFAVDAENAGYGPPGSERP